MKISYFRNRRNPGSFLVSNKRTSNYCTCTLRFLVFLGTNEVFLWQRKHGKSGSFLVLRMVRSPNDAIQKFEKILNNYGLSVIPRNTRESCVLLYFVRTLNGRASSDRIFFYPPMLLLNLSILLSILPLFFLKLELKETNQGGDTGENFVSIHIRC